VTTNWENLLAGFVPTAPLVLVPLLFCIEVVSYLVRPLALMVRIMVNLACGHLLLIVSGMLVISGSWLPMALVLVLELGVCLVQSFVLFLLLSM
jgi:F-type H+-transporting ATPase subunit a